MTYPAVLILGGVLAIGVATVQVPDLPHWFDVIAAAVGGFAVAIGLQDLGICVSVLDRMNHVRRPNGGL